MSKRNYLPDHVHKWFVSLFEQETGKSRKRVLKLLKEDGPIIRALIMANLEEAMLYGLDLAKKDYCLTGPDVNAIALLGEECASEVLQHLRRHFLLRTA